MFGGGGGGGSGEGEGEGREDGEVRDGDDLMGLRGGGVGHGGNLVGVERFKSGFLQGKPGVLGLMIIFRRCCTICESDCTWGKKAIL